MKRLQVCCLLAFLFAVFVSCGNTLEYPEVTTEKDTFPPETVVISPYAHVTEEELKNGQQGKDSKAFPFLYTTATFADSERSIYFGNGYTIMYYGKNGSTEAKYLCPDPLCGHERKECVFADITLLGYANGRVFFRKEDPKTKDPALGMNEYEIICSCDEYGGDYREIASVYRPLQCAFSNARIYILNDNIETEKKALNYIDFSDNALKSFLLPDDIGLGYILYAVDGVIYANSSKGIIAISEADGSVKKIGINENLTALSASGKYVWFCRGTTVYRYDPETGKTDAFNVLSAGDSEEEINTKINISFLYRGEIYLSEKAGSCLTVYKISVEELTSSPSKVLTLSFKNATEVRFGGITDGLYLIYRESVGKNSYDRIRHYELIDPETETVYLMYTNKPAS